MALTVTLEFTEEELDYFRSRMHRVRNRAEQRPPHAIAAAALAAVARLRSTLLQPGSMIVAQPEIPTPILLGFPFPAWATRASEAGPNPSAVDLPADPFAGLPGQ